jgi:small subunit ribosomal protein S1
MDNLDDQIAEEAAEVVGHPMDFLLEDDFSLGVPKAGEIRTGVVVAQRNNAIIVDINAKSEGLIGASDLERLDEASKSRLEVGNEIPVYVVNPEDREGNIILSYSKAIEEEDWERAQALEKTQDVLECRVIGYNRGGVLTRLGALRGFVPASQLTSVRQRGNNRSEDMLRGMVGKKIKAKVIEVDRSRNRLILSQRAAEREARAAMRTELMDSLGEGDVIEGTVVNLADFGAFVDIGGMEGLVHISELSWKRQIKPSDIVGVGDHIEVMVINVDEKRGRVGLSLKRLEPDPWTTLEERYQVGQLVEAVVTKVTDYGAFARLTNDEYDFEGLIHISEMAQDRIEHPNEIVHRGQVVTARIIRLAPDQKQIGLSLKEVASSAYMDADLAWAAPLEEE